MPATNTTLPQLYFDEEVQWWITSIPPYYCYTNGTPGDDFSADDIWLGVSSADAKSKPVPSKTTGLKYAYTSNYGSSFPGGTNIQYINALGAPFPLEPLNKVGTPYNPFPLQSAYEVGPARLPLAFGPYPLNKTDDGSGYPVSDGDIILITTGSDVLAGIIEDSGTALGAGDNRMFNLILYSTGSNDVEVLSGGVNKTSLAKLTDYTPTIRDNYIQGSGGVFGFVAIESDEAFGTFMWWPLSWDVSDSKNIISRNDS